MRGLKLCVQDGFYGRNTRTNPSKEIPLEENVRVFLGTGTASRRRHQPLHRWALPKGGRPSAPELAQDAINGRAGSQTAVAGPRPIRPAGVFFLEGDGMRLIEKNAITTIAYWLRVHRIRPNFAQ
jgi:hypothetical protein